MEAGEHCGEACGVCVCTGEGGAFLGTDTALSHRIYLLIGLRKSTSPQHRQLDILVRNGKKKVDVL